MDVGVEVSALSAALDSLSSCRLVASGSSFSVIWTNELPSVPGFVLMLDDMSSFEFSDSTLLGGVSEDGCFSDMSSADWSF